MFDQFNYLNFNLSSSAPNYNSLSRDQRTGNLGRSLGTTETNSSTTIQRTRTEINMNQGSNETMDNRLYETDSICMSQTDPVYFNPNFSTSSPIFTRLINSNKNSNPISLQSQFWEIDSDVSGCRSCQKPFSLFVRRHHCRRCGLIYCDSCSSARIDLKNYHLTYDLSGSINSEEEAPTPQRVCDPCYKIIRSGPRLPPVEIPVLLKRTDSQASILTECPVCSKRLIAISANKEDHETHINACLEGNSFDGTNNSSRYLVFTLEEDSPMLRQECTICLEEFKQADRIARLNCLCCFHRSCIQEWFFQNTSCPIHFH